MFARLLVLSALSVAAVAQAQNALPDYPQSQPSSVTRAEVRQAAIEARQLGLTAQGDKSVAIDDFMAERSRARVAAEAREAVRLGLSSRGEHNVIPTAAQLEQIRQAGLRAEMAMMAAR